MSKLLLSIVLPFLISCNTSESDKRKDDSDVYNNKHDTLGETHARNQINELLNGKAEPFIWDTLIKNGSTAIALAETILFEEFGKEQILSEKPYEVYLINGYWYISGTIPKDSDGGAFEIILNARNAEIIRLTHYK